jgi:hypothetical protein
MLAEPNSVRVMEGCCLSCREAVGESACLAVHYEADGGGFWVYPDIWVICFALLTSSLWVCILFVKALLRGCQQLWRC